MISNMFKWNATDVGMSSIQAYTKHTSMKELYSSNNTGKLSKVTKKGHLA